MTTLNDWKRDSKYGWSHPTGWNMKGHLAGCVRRVDPLVQRLEPDATLP